MAASDLHRLSAEHRRALNAYAHKHGRTWRSKLLAARARGGYGVEGPLVHAVNLVGPSGIRAYRVTVENPGRKRKAAKRTKNPSRPTRMGHACKAPKRRPASASRKRKPAKRRKNPDDGFEFASLDGNMSPATQVKLRRLVKERAPLHYAIEAHDNSADAKVMRRRRVAESGHGSYGRARYSIKKSRLPGLLIAMVRSGREDEYDLASGILSTLDIELV